VLARHPRLIAVIAHLGAPEYREFLDLAVAYPGVHQDTTMVFTDFMEKIAPFPPPFCRGWPISATGSFWAAPSRTFPTPTSASFGPWPVSALAWNGCVRHATAMRLGC
jgi:Amidohydrolase